MKRYLIGAICGMLLGISAFMFNGDSNLRVIPSPTFASVSSVKI